MLTDKQKDTYNYLMGKMGKGYAEAYRKHLQEETSAKVALNEYENNPRYQDKGQKLLDYGAYAVKKGTEDATVGLGRALIGDDSIAPLTTEEHLNRLIRSDKDNSKLYNFGLDVTQGVARQIPGIALSALLGGLGVPSSVAQNVGLSFTSAGAWGGGYEQARREGYSVAQAAGYGAFQGSIEAITGRLLNGAGTAALGEGTITKALKDKVVNKALNMGVAKFISSPTGKLIAQKGMDYLIDMSSEALEEYIQELAEKGYRNIAFDEQNKIDLRDPEAWYSALIGAASAAVMGAGGVHSLSNHNSLRTDLIGNEVLQDSVYRIPEANTYQIEADPLNNTRMPATTNQKPLNEYGEIKNNGTPSVSSYYDSYFNNYDTDTAYLHKTQSEIEQTARDNDIRLSSIDEIAEQFGKQGKEAFKANYNPNINNLTYEDGFKAAYEAGRNRAGFESITAPAYHLLSSKQQIEAYNAGLIDFERANQNKPLASKEGGLTDESVKINESNVYNAMLSQAIGDYTGLQVELVDSLPRDANGIYKPKANKVYLSTNAENFNATASHELTHFIKRYDETSYNLYMDTAIKAYTQAQGKNIDTLIDEYRGRYGNDMSRDNILEEIVADASAHFFNDEQFINKVASENVSLSKSIVDFFSDIIDSINHLISKVTNRDVADTLKNNKKLYEKARKYWLKGLENASKANKSKLNNNFMESKKIGVSRKVSTINELVERVKNNPDDNWSVVKVAEQVNERLAKEIERLTGISVKGWSIELSADRMRHIIKRHGKNGSADRTMSNYGDLNLIPNVQENFTDIKLTENKNTYRDSDGTSSKTILLTMEDGSEYVHIVEAIPNTKKKTIQIISAYKSKIDLTTKKTPYPALNRTNSSPKLNVQNDAELGVKDSIAQDKEEVNLNEKNFSFKNEVGEDKHSLKVKTESNTGLKSLQKENSYLKRKVQSLKEEFKLTKDYEPRQDDVARIAHKLKVDLKSTYDRQALKENLTKIFKYINKYNGENTEEVMQVSANLAKDLLQQSRDFENSISPELKEVRQAIKSYSFKLSSTDLADLAVVGGYENIRRHYFGKISLSKTKGIGVDIAYQELSNQYPWLFDTEINNTSDQLLKILDVISMTESTDFNEYGMDIDEYSYAIAEDIFQMYFDVRQKQTFADIQAAKLNNAKSEYTQKHYEKIKEINEKHKAQIKAQRERLKEEYREKLKEIKKENSKNLSEATKEYNKKIKELRKELKKEITKKTRENYKEKLKQKKGSVKDRAKIAKLEKQIAALTKAQMQRINALSSGFNIVIATNSTGDVDVIRSKGLNRLVVNPHIAEDNSPYAIANTDEHFKECCDKYGIMPKGVNPTRDIDVPNAQNDYQKVSKVARTVLESDYISDELVEPIKEELLSGRFSYYEKTNSFASKQVERIIKTQGYEKAMLEWEQRVYEGNPSKEDIVLAEALMKIASENKRAEDVLKILAQLQAVSTNAGQVIQAISMLKTHKVSDSLVKSIDLLNAKDTEKFINRFLVRKYKNKEYVPEVKLNDELVSQMLNAQNAEDIEKAKGNIIKDLAEQIPSTWGDKWNAWRYLSMLFSVKTHVRNVLGNAMFYPTVTMRNKISFLLQNTFNVDEKTHTLLGANNEYKEFAKNDYKIIKDNIENGWRHNPTELVMKQRKIFKSGVLNWLSDFNSNMLEKEDQIFMGRYYKMFLGEYLQANNVDLSNISEDLLQRARDYAVNEVKKATYRDNSKIANALNNAAKTNVVSDVFISGVLPFKKTPVKILQRGFEYSPYGVAKSLTYDLMQVKQGKISKAELFDNISAGLTGTGIMMLGFYLAKLGILTGGADDDKKQNTLQKLFGVQSYSIKVGKYSYTLEWAVPSNIPLFMGVELERELRNDDNVTVADYIDAMGKITAPMFNLSMLQGFNRLLEDVSYAQGSNKVTAFAVSAISSFFGQMFPQIGGQIARTLDPVSRTVYVDKNSFIPEPIQKFYQRNVLGKTPGQTGNANALIDNYGNEKRNDSFLSRAFQNFISPGYISEEVTDDVFSEVSRLYNETGEGKVVLGKQANSFKVFGEGEKKEDYNLSAEEYEELQKLAGQLSYQLADNIIKDPKYSDLSDSDRVEVIAKAYDYARKVSRYEINNNYELDSFSAKALDASKEGVPVDDYIYLWYLTKGKKKAEKKDVFNRYGVSKRVQDLFNGKSNK